MTKDTNNSNNKKPKLNPYWIYGIIIAVFIGIQIIGGSAFSNTKEISNSEFISYLENGDIEKVVIVSNTKTAKVFLTKEAFDKEVHKNAKPSSLIPSNEIPNYTLKFGDLQNFENRIDTIINDNNLSTVRDADIENNAWGDFFLQLLPFILIIGVWIFIMRRMSSGGGGGAGGQIFNIGKSKAKLFDEKSDTKTSFKDVAGLEGAKEEVQEIVDFLKYPEKYT